jgi:predicted amidophosphoribosyltransferase
MVMDQKTHECANCGADLLNSQKTCKYCGSPNPNYVAPIIPSFTNTSSDYHSESACKVSKTNWVVFVILLIVFWPAAIIYAIATSASK